MAINQDIVEGKLKQAEGKAQDVRGDLTNNPEDDLNGKAKQVEGKIQEGIGKAKIAVDEALNSSR